MSEKITNKISRRSFLGTSLIGAAGLTFIPSCLSKSPNSNINLGFIGVGRQSVFLLNSFLDMEGVRVLAAADVYDIKLKRFEKRVTEYYADKGVKSEVKTYENYQDLLARKDIDAVVIATPDHWHALIAIDACKAGKDIYLEKPLTWTIKEGDELVKAVRENNVILGVGSQQRSDPFFQHATKLAQSGQLGKLTKVQAYIGPFPEPYDMPEEPIPAGLNWDKWLGPNPYVHYNSVLNPPISLDPPQDEQFWAKWRYYKETGGGYTTDWGAHMFDIAQWGMGKDKSGPVEIIPPGIDGHEFLSFRYENGLMMVKEPYDENKTFGVKFIGEDAWVSVSRGKYDASDESLIPNAKQGEGPYETKASHQQNFIDAVKNKVDPIVPVEIGHSTATVCNLANIAFWLNRSVKWDPTKNYFVNDAEAEKYYHRQYREGYSL